MGKKSHADLLSQLDNYLAEIRVEKQASENDGTTTSHPVANEDDQTQPTQEGSRSSENESDVSSQNPGSINDASVPAEGDSKNPADSQGTVSQDSEQTSGNVTQPDGSVPDPGTSHPANAEFGGKYASLSEVANGLLAQIAVMTGGDGVPPKTEKSAETECESENTQKKEDASEKSDEPKVEAEETSDVEEKEAEHAGYEAATKLAELIGFEGEEVKTAADQIVKEAQDNASAAANAWCDYLAGYSDAVMAKQAMGMDMAGGMGGIEELMAPPEGAPDAEAAPALEDELAGAPEEGAMGEPGEEDVAAALAQALEDSGVSEEEFASAIAELAGGEGEADAAPAVAEEAVEEESTPAEDVAAVEDAGVEDEMETAASAKSMSKDEVKGLVMDKLAALLGSK